MAFPASSFFPAKLWRFALAGLALSSCTQTHQTTAAPEPPRSPYSDADAWHRQTLLDWPVPEHGNRLGEKFRDRAR